MRNNILRFLYGDVMLPLLFRGIIIYVVLIASVRIMGKRQIGELQPSELVITILLSQIASLPLESGETPLLGCIISIMLLVSLEVISSVLIMKFPKIRSIVQGNKVLIINKGKIDQKRLKDLRLTVEELAEALRMKDVFSFSDVYMAYVETNGTLSVKLKGTKEAVTLEDINIISDDKDFECLIISDGRIIKKDFTVCNLTDDKLKRILKKNKVNKEDILIMTYAENGSYNIILKEKQCKKD